MLVHHLLQNGRDDIAVIDRGNRFSYKTLRILTDRFRNYLYAQGVRRGDRVGIFSRKTVHYITAYMAIASLGAIAVPINVQLSQREVAYMLRDAGCSYLLTNKIFDWAKHPRTRDLEGKIHQLDIDAYVETDEPAAPALPDDFTDTEPYIIIYTSGTTGKPKGALLSHNNVTTNAQQVQDALHIASEDNVLCVPRCASLTKRIMMSPSARRASSSSRGKTS